MWPWCNLATYQTERPYCVSVNSHSPVGLVSWQWDAVDWACVLCDRCIHFDTASRSANLHQCARPFYSSHTGFYWQTSHHPGLSAPLKPRFVSLRLLVFPEAKIAVEREEVCECDGHTVHKLSQQCFIAEWLAPRDSDCSRIHNNVSSDWLPSYIKATWPVLEIFKMGEYFLDRPHTVSHLSSALMFIDGCLDHTVHRKLTHSKVFFNANLDILHNSSVLSLCPEYF